LVIGGPQWAIPEEKATLLDSMGVQVDVEEAPFIIREKLLCSTILLSNDLFSGKYGRLHRLIGVLVASIQVLVHRVVTIVASVDPVWI
jgi:hypothetical protein